jgi:hypothetical protein
VYIPIFLYLYSIMTKLKVMKATYRSTLLFPPPPVGVVVAAVVVVVVAGAVVVVVVGRPGAIPSQSLQRLVEQTLANSLLPAPSESPPMSATLHPRCNQKIRP